MGGCESVEKAPKRDDFASPQRVQAERDADEDDKPGVGAPITGDPRRGAFICRDCGEHGLDVVKAVLATKRDGKKGFVATSPEVTVATYRINEDGDGVLKSLGIGGVPGGRSPPKWSVEMQYIKTGASEASSVVDICQGDLRVVQLRMTAKGPIAVGYPAPYPTTDSPLSYPSPVPTAESRPYFWIQPPESIGGDEVRAFRQGMFNIKTCSPTMDDAIVATVRSQVDRSIALHVTREMDFAVALAFVVARTLLE
eukprot:TRINITY_DN14367_c0_g1_i1.p1 TRINITY_DN14367_c0_g1~~TRINITY_DN14367_c0_g1_i1.p1  ORF type:complete len:254 (+),score=65.08 TRINITY_DN14367_c0_g1_i1:57-818(+)